MTRISYKLLCCWIVVLAPLSPACAEDNLVAGPANGGFENSPLSWKTVAGSASLSRNSYRGSNACLLVGGPDGAGVNSAPFKVFEGRTYKLTSLVKQTAGTGHYKVTITWRDPAGKILRYDNDWKGINRPSQYTSHKGSFLAPENATTAVIMLGVAKETDVLFDDVVLELKNNAYQIWACPDFRYDANNFFSPNSPWKNAAKQIDVFKLHIRELQDNDPLRNWKLNVSQMVKYLKDNDIALGLEAAGTMGGANCGGDTGQKSALAERSRIDRIYGAGGTVKYLMLDGSISRTIRGGRLKDDGGASGNCGYTLSQSVGHLVAYMKVIHSKYPKIKIGLGVNYDHWGFQGYKAFFGNKVENYTRGSHYRYNQVLDALLPAVAKAGEKIHFIHVDNPCRPYYVAAKSPFGGANLDQKGRLRSIQSYCASRKIDFGVMYNTQDARSNRAFFNETINMLESHVANGIQPKHLTVESWYANMPSEYLPDTKLYTFMNLVNQFGGVAARQRPGRHAR